MDQHPSDITITIFHLADLDSPYCERQLSSILMAVWSFHMTSDPGNMVQFDREKHKTKLEYIMDPIHVLASQKLKRNTAVASRAETDAFYDAHGCETFLRLRRWNEAFTTRFSALGSSKPKTEIFAPSQRNV
jgi:hypothetical protein